MKIIDQKWKKEWQDGWSDIRMKETKMGEMKWE